MTRPHAAVTPRAHLHHLAEKLLYIGRGEPDRMQPLVEGMQRMIEYVAPLVNERIENPGDDCISVLAQGEKKGVFTRHQVLVNASLLLLAGHEPTGCPTGFRADAVATAKRDLKPGELLDGEGGYTVVGRLMPAADSLMTGALPLGLAHGWRLTQPVAAGEVVRWTDVAVDEANSVVRVRREMEQTCAAQPDMVLT